MKNNLRLLKQEFLKKWIKGLQICSTSLSSSSSSSSSNNNNNNKKIVGVLERKNAIKLSANLAMAFAKKGNTSWSRAIITKAANNSYSSSSSSSSSYNYSKILYHNINNNINTNSRRRSSISYYYKKNKKKKKKVVKHYSSGFLAKRLVEKRREILKRLVPGGEECLDDEVSLIKETLDYILCLKAQVDVMRSLLTCNNHNVIYN